MEIRAWLAQIGLEAHADSFIENAVGMELLSELTNEDLKDLGVVKLGERKAILKAIAENAAIRPPPHADATSPVIGLEGERRQVTVLFADLSDFTKLSTSLDAEETHRLLNHYFEVVDGIVINFGGSVDKHIGDSVMAVFGAPVAHTNDPERAIRAARAIHDAMTKLSAELGLPLQTHVGIASGQVVASGTGSDAHRTYTVTGDTVNLASRLDDMAEPGETLVSRTVQQATASVASFANKQTVWVKGLDKAIEVWALTGLREGPPGDHLGPFVGRRAELRQFKAILDDCLDEGQGQAILIRGEPGIGKTRLIEEVSGLAAERGFSIHRGLVLDFGVGRGQDAVRSLVRSLLDIAPGGDKADRAQAANTAVARGLIGKDDLIYLNDLLNLPQPLELQSLYDAMEPGTRNEGKRRCVMSLFVARAKEAPCLAVVEDIHWADPLTLNHLTSLSSSIVEVPALLVMSTRLEGRTLDQDWLASMRGCPLTTMELHPLRAAQALALAKAIASEKEENLDAIITRSEGNPLFIEQMVRSTELGHQADLPDTIQGLVLARIDQLPMKDREAMQAASVIGQRFSLEIVRVLLEDETYEPKALLRHRLVRPVGDELLFGHALIQQGIYASLLKERRSALHSRAAGWFAEHDRALYAAHLDRAEDPHRARAYLEAAHDAASVYHYEKADSLLRRGIEVANDSKDRIELLCALGELLHDRGRITESMAAFQEALDRADNDRARCHAWYGLAMGLRVQDDQDAALVLLDQAQPVAETLGLKELLGRIAGLRGNLYFIIGDLQRCLTEHNNALEYARETGSVELEAKALGGLADAHYSTGRVVTAFRFCEDCIALANEHGLGRVAVAYLSMLGLIKLFLMDVHEANRLSKEAVIVSQRLGHQRAEVMGRLVLAYVLNDSDHHRESLEVLEPCKTLIDNLGLEVFKPEIPQQRSDALFRMGQQQDACRELEIASDLARQTRPTYTLAAVLGRLAYVTDDPAQREAALKEGLERLESGSLSHNYFDFYRYAIETMLHVRAWDRVEHFAAKLEAYPVGEIVPWSRFYAARGRSLAAFGAGKRDEETISQLRALHAEALRCGAEAAAQRLQEAIKLCDR